MATMANKYNILPHIALIWITIPLNNSFEILLWVERFPSFFTPGLYYIICIPAWCYSASLFVNNILDMFFLVDPFKISLTNPSYNLDIQKYLDTTLLVASFWV